MGRRKQLGKEGWDGGCSSPESSGPCQEVTLGKPRLHWGQPCSGQEAAARLGTPSPNTSMSLGAPAELSAAAHPAPCRAPRRPGPFPCPPCSGSQRIGAFSAGAAGRHRAASAPRQAPRTVARGRARVAEAGRPHGCPCRALPLRAACGRSTPPTAPFPPADLGEPLTTLGRVPGSKLHTQPHPSSPKWARGAGPASTPLPAKGLLWPRPPDMTTAVTAASYLLCHKSLVFLGKQPKICVLAR